MRDTQVGRVLGTDDASPLAFYVVLDEGAYAQLDDVVAVDRELPDRTRVQIHGVVTEVRARYEGVSLQGDTALVADGLMPADTSQVARISVTRLEPEVYVPPLPGTPVRLARGEERARALYFDGMEGAMLPAGLTRDGEPFYVNEEFLNGERGGHIIISGTSGVATKTSYALFIVQSLLSARVGERRPPKNQKVVVFNMKGEDLLFLDKANRAFPDEARREYDTLSLPAEPFSSVDFWAPPSSEQGGQGIAPRLAGRSTGVRPFAWSLREFCEKRLLRFLFTDPDDHRQQYTMVLSNVADQLEKATGHPDGTIEVDQKRIRTFRELVSFIRGRLEDDDHRRQWAGPSVAPGTIGAFMRRLHAVQRDVAPLIRGDLSRPDDYEIRREQDLTVVDIHNLPDRAKQFVVGVVLNEIHEERDARGAAAGTVYVVLDELNKYAPRDGFSPIKDILLDISERGRSLGVILVGAQQTASEVERRVVSNAAIKVVGRLDPAEADRGEYGFLGPLFRERAVIAKPGSMIVSQPQIPVPVMVRFPFPPFATREKEVAESDAEERQADETVEAIFRGEAG